MPLEWESMRLRGSPGNLRGRFRVDRGLSLAAGNVSGTGRDAPSWLPPKCSMSYGSCIGTETYWSLRSVGVFLSLVRT